MPMWVAPAPRSLSDSGQHGRALHIMYYASTSLVDLLVSQGAGRFQFQAFPECLQWFTDFATAPPKADDPSLLGQVCMRYLPGAPTSAILSTLCSRKCLRYFMKWYTPGW